MELLVAIGLMVMIMGMVAMVFSQSTSVYRESMEVLAIQNSASAACDLLKIDLSGCLPLENGQQEFRMGEDAAGKDDADALDWITFTATVDVNGEIRGGHVTYKLYKDTDPTIMRTGGTGATETIRTKKTLYVLRREVKDMDNKPLDSGDLCHYLLSFNLEYFDGKAGKFRQISKFNQADWPIGDNKPENEVLPSKLRVTMRVVAGARALKERTITREIWLPMGQ